MEYNFFNISLYNNLKHKFMKTIFLIVVTFLSLNFVFGQDTSKFVFKSKVIRIINNTIYPIDTIDFMGCKKCNPRSKLDIDKVRSFLVESLIEYRADNGTFTPIKEDKRLTYESNIWAEKLKQNFKHATREERGNCSEVICIIPLFVFARVTDDMGDFNKLVAETIFDIFHSSLGHATILNTPKYENWGFGIYYDGGGGIYICFRGKSTPNQK